MAGVCLHLSDPHCITNTALLGATTSSYQSLPANAEKTIQIPAAVRLMWLEFTDIYLMHKYGPFQGHQI
jgi:hypothetical protein